MRHWNLVRNKTFSLISIRILSQGWFLININWGWSLFDQTHWLFWPLIDWSLVLFLFLSLLLLLNSSSRIIFSGLDPLPQKIFPYLLGSLLSRILIIEHFIATVYLRLVFLRFLLKLVWSQVLLDHIIHRLGICVCIARGQIMVSLLLLLF